MNKITNIIASVASVAMIAIPLAGTSLVSASENVHGLSIPHGTIIRGEEGSKHQVSQEKIDPKHLGSTCKVNVTSTNQGSVHPGNNLVIASGSTSVVVKDVEREAYGVIKATGEITLANQITVSVVLGKDRVFSGGMYVNFECTPPVKEVKVCRNGRVVTIKETDRDNTDTAAPCPAPEIHANLVCSLVDGEAEFTLKANKTSGDVAVEFTPASGTVMPNGSAVEVTASYNDGTGTKTVKTTAPSAADCTPEEEIEVCRDGNVISILESDKKDSDTSVPCPTPEEKTIEVCRDGTIITIKESEKLASDTEGCVESVVTELPNTGAGSVVGLIASTFVGGTAFAQVRLRRRG